MDIMDLIYNTLLLFNKTYLGLVFTFESIKPLIFKNYNKSIVMFICLFY